MSAEVRSDALRAAERKEFAGVVTALAITPVKGMRLHSVETVELTATGAVGNRHFFLIDEKGKLTNGKRIGELSAVLAEYDPGAEQVTLHFPDGSTVSGDVATGLEQEAKFFSRTQMVQVVAPGLGEALSEYAGTELRLVRADPALTAVDRGPRGSVSLISNGSVAHLSDVAGRLVDPRRFRMLIEVAGPSAHQEDALVGAVARVGDALVRFHGHVGRCLVTGQDPDTGIADLPTLELLRYRKGLETTEPLAFGIYGEVLEPGTVRLGDSVNGE